MTTAKTSQTVARTNAISMTTMNRLEKTKLMQTQRRIRVEAASAMFRHLCNMKPKRTERCRGRAGWHTPTTVRTAQTAQTVQTTQTARRVPLSLGGPLGTPEVVRRSGRRAALARAAVRVGTRGAAEPAKAARRRTTVGPRFYYVHGTAHDEQEDEEDQEDDFLPCVVGARDRLVYLVVDVGDGFVEVVDDCPVRWGGGQSTDVFRQAPKNPNPNPTAETTKTQAASSRGCEPMPSSEAENTGPAGNNGRCEKRPAPCWHVEHRAFLKRVVVPQRLSCVRYAPHDLVRRVVDLACKLVSTA